MSLASFGVRKPVPINLLMWGFLIAGVLSATTLRKQFFPEVAPEAAMVSLVYPGATPEEIEDTLAIKVEDAVVDLDEVDELNTSLGEGGGGIVVNFVEGQDPDKALDEVERKINALQDLPDEAEEITVTLMEHRLPVIMLTVYGELDEQVMKRAVNGIKDDLQTMRGMGEIVIGGVRPYELRIDVRQTALLEQGVSITAVSDAIRRYMDEVPGGTVRNRAGNTNVRTMGTPENADAIGSIVIKATADGSVIRVGDVATVTEGFADTGVKTRFDGLPAANLTVFKVGDQDIVKIAEMVRGYVAGRQHAPFPGSWLDRRLKRHMTDGYALGLHSTRALPAGARVEAFTDLARFVEGRLDLLLRNAVFGAVLVFSTLLLFLNWRVAFWVGIGLVTSLAGTLVFMGVLNVTLNLLTMFGLIVVLGLLVDDAIVVSENIQTRHENGEPSLDAAIAGTGEVQWPVVATVMTSIVAFLPLTFIKGSIGDLLGALPVVVACALLMSLIESLLILPAHMGHSLIHRDRHREKHAATHDGKPGIFQRFEKRRDAVIQDRVLPGYERFLRFMLRHRYVSVAVMVAVLLASLGMVAGKRVAFEFLPQNDAETVVVNLRLPIGTPESVTSDVVGRIERAAQQQPEFKSVATVVGETSNMDTGETTPFSSHLGQLFIELKPVEQRDRASPDIIASIRDALEGRLDEVERISFEPVSGGPGGPDISVDIRGADTAQIESAVAELKLTLKRFAGVVDVADNNDLGQAEQRIIPRPAAAAAAGLTPNDIAFQVRGFLFGLEPHNYAAEREDIEVRVRVDEDTRRSLNDIENAWLVTPDGRNVPLGEVADIVSASTYASIKRVDRMRSVAVTAYTLPGVSPEDVTGQLDLDALRAKHPSLDITFGGRQEQMKDAFSSLPLGAGAAAIMIYIILAWLFSSYVQPLVVMAVIPFALIGVVWGHYFLGYALTFLSLIGVVALSGIVVNDSLIFVEFFNLKRADGVPVFEALVQAGRARLRAIFLTTVTTVLGLTPLILEQSFQAKFLIPMAISIAGGLIAATALTLGVLPAFILILDDFKRGARWLWTGGMPCDENAAAHGHEPPTPPSPTQAALPTG